MGYSKRPSKPAPSRCPKRDCNQLKPCRKHPQGWAGSRSTPLPPNWGSLRALTRKSARGLCRKCGVLCWDTGECDHITNRAVGGTDHISNLQWLCKNCHAVKTRRESKEGNRNSKSGRKDYPGKGSRYPRTPEEGLPEINPFDSSEGSEEAPGDLRQPETDSGRTENE